MVVILGPANTQRKNSIYKKVMEGQNGKYRDERQEEEEWQRLSAQAFDVPDQTPDDLARDPSASVDRLL